ncbi:hypothetical protein ACFW6E_46110, partial [Streptomyces olivaceoviridis]|uniref:hypothetical protein n=1 Tax=Streptomyces olivaceoviridis TaxID=1921 RepID=UPI00369C6AA8
MRVMVGGAAEDANTSARAAVSVHVRQPATEGDQAVVTVLNPVDGAARLGADQDPGRSCQAPAPPSTGRIAPVTYEARSLS